MNHEEHKSSVANETDIICEHTHVNSNHDTGYTVTPSAAPEASAEQTTPTNTEPSGKYPPPEVIDSFMKSLFQNKGKPHPHRALNPETAQCDKGAQPYTVLKQNQTIHDLERLLPHPVRKRNTVNIERADSFIRYVKAHQIEGATAIYQSTSNDNQLQLKAIIDDHETGSDGQANWQTHKAIYRPKLSREWLIWNKVNECEVSQEHFAQFIERNMPDIAEPAGSTLLEIVRTLESKKNVHFKSGVRLDNGDFSIQYEETSTAKAGEKGTLDIPSIIKLAIPVYEGGAPYAIEARFRYRIKDASLTMWYELVRPQDIREHADNSISQEITGALTDIPLYHGDK